MRRGWGPPPQRRPQWWPEGEGWPPARRWGRRGPPVVWRLGCVLLAVIAFAGLFGALVTTLIGLVLDLLLGPFGIQPASWAYGTAAALAVVIAIFVVLSARRGIRRLATPIDELIEAAARIEAGDYSARVRETGPREVRSVARAFNSMSARLETSNEQRRSFLADVTHELRTPLAVIRGQAEGIADGLYPADAEHLAPILDATHMLEGLVDDLRTLALAEAGSLVLSREPVEPSSMVFDTLASFESQADEAHVSLTADIGEGVPMVDVDVQRMRSVIGNVVSNALHHTQAGGSIRVAVRSEGDWVTISVTDSGEGIAPDLLPHVFDRFVRGPGSKGSGLGLAIVHDIVTAHGGHVGISSTPGAGTTVTLKLPPAGSNRSPSN